MKRAWIGMFMLGAWLHASSVQAEAGAQSRVLVRSFRGPSATPVRDAVVAELGRHSLETVSEAAIPAQADLESSEGRVEAARDLKIAAFVTGQLERAGRSLRLQLTVYSGRDGSQIAELSLSAAKAPQLVRRIEKQLWDAVGSALQAAKPPEALPPPPKAEPVAAAAPEPAPAPGAEPEEQTEGGSHGHSSPLDVAVGARIGSRQFAYNDPLPGLRDYTLGPSPSVALHLHWYPVAHVSDGVLANLGLDLRGEMLLGVSSKNSAGNEFSTSSTQLGAGLRFRLPFAKNELGLLAGYGLHSFHMAASKGVEPGVPDVTHGFVRVGADLRWLVAEPVAVYLEAAYLAGLSHGEIAGQSWFPHAAGGGLEAELGVGYGMARSLELQVAVAMQRYFFSFNPSPTDPSVVGGQHRVAGGALDQFLSLRLSLLLRL